MSTFLKALLGEASVISGSVEVNAAGIAFCDQTPFFLPVGERFETM
jgi:hypothetical protein